MVTIRKFSLRQSLKKSWKAPRVRLVVKLLSCFLVVMILNSNNYLSKAINLKVNNYYNILVKKAMIPIEGIERIGNKIDDLTHVYEKNYQLIEENKKLRSEIESLKTRLSQEEEVKKLLKTFPSDPEKVIVAKVLYKNFTPFSMSVTINVGKNDGIAEDDVVLSEFGLAGIIDKAYTHSSRVIILHDPLMRIPVVFKKSGCSGIVKGMANFRKGLKIIHLNCTKNLIANEVVITSGIGGIYPYDIAIGNVEKNSKIYVRSKTDWMKLGYVMIIKSSYI